VLVVNRRTADGIAIESTAVWITHLTS